ncbi:hypothetical protein [Undibacterium cyanobacteriorum]|uniref:hypothetical protein n=1 Tax=Undibacterium cyanobacteriorum TaxID=3073561 RepID=UPI0035A27C0F
MKRLPTDTLWQTQARGSARDDVYSIASQVTRSLLSRKESIATWHGFSAGVRGVAGVAWVGVRESSQDTHSKK